MLQSVRNQFFVRYICVQKLSAKMRATGYSRSSWEPTHLYNIVNNAMHVLWQGLMITDIQTQPGLLLGTCVSVSSEGPGRWCGDEPLSPYEWAPTPWRWAQVGCAAFSQPPLSSSVPGFPRSDASWPHALNHPAPLPGIWITCTITHLILSVLNRKWQTMLCNVIMCMEIIAGFFKGHIYKCIFWQCLL